MSKVIEKFGCKWLVDESYAASLEPIREYEHTVIDLSKKLSDGREIFVDVGACVGKYSVIMCKHYSLVYAIEPNPENLNFLKKNIELNQCNNIEIIDKVITTEKSIVSLSLRGAQSSILTNSAVKQIEVEADRLDNLITDADVIKIDVEGAEYLVVLSSEGLIKNSKPVFIIEHNEYWAGDKPNLHKKILNKLMSFGYTPFNLNNTHWVYVPSENLGELSEEVRATLIRNHIFYEVIVKNLRSGRAWYHGLHDKWWHGMSITDFYLSPDYHFSDLSYWKNLYTNSLKYYT